jgi:hypothetical protein
MLLYFNGFFLPIKAEFDHVVPPDVIVDWVVRVVVPAVLDVPSPGLVPQHVQAVEEYDSVVQPTPSGNHQNWNLQCFDYTNIT